MTTREAPPVAKYRLELTITGNSHTEIEQELHYFLHGGFIIQSDGYKRDQFTCYSGRATSKLRHANPEMTPERYEAEFHDWIETRKAARRAEASRG